MKMEETFSATIAFKVMSTPTMSNPEVQTFLTPLNLFLIIIGVTGFFCNLFPLYVVFIHRGRLTSNTPQSRDVLLAALSLVNILTVAIPLPIFLVNYNVNSSTSLPLERPTICEMFHLSFVWLNLASLFLITTLNYTSYLTMTSNGDNHYSSITDQISNSFSCSRSNARGFYQRQRKWSLSNLVIGIALVAFLIASLPYLGLGPEGSHSNFTMHGKYLCSLEQISYPKKEKEYTFLFAVLMSTSACLLLHTVHSVVNCSGCYLRPTADRLSKNSSSVVADTDNKTWSYKVNRSYAVMISLLGFSFYVTWIPVMVSVGTIMSAYRVSDRFSEYVIVIAFVNPCVAPLLSGAFLRTYRDGYSDLSRLLVSLLSKVKECSLNTKKYNQGTFSTSAREPLSTMNTQV